MIRRKWKIFEITPITQKGYWEFETDVLDLSGLSASKNDTSPMYFQSIAGRKLIKFKHTPFYWEILKISPHTLKMGLHGIDPTTHQDYLIAEFNCISMND